MIEIAGFVVEAKAFYLAFQISCNIDVLNVFFLIQLNSSRKDIKNNIDFILCEDSNNEARFIMTSS